jgi:serine protease Do
MFERPTLRATESAVRLTAIVRNAIAAAGARKVDLELYRDGKLRTIPAALSEATGEKEGPQSSASGKPAERGLDGITLNDLSPEARRAFRITDAAIKGVVITDLEPNSPAARAGLRPGDVLMEVNRRPVTNVREFQDAYGKARGNVLLLVHRRGNTQFIVVKR